MTPVVLRPRQANPRPGRIQSFACLILVNAGFVIRFASENSARLVGREAATLVGQIIDDVFDAYFVHALRNHANQIVLVGGAQREFRAELLGAAVDVTIASSHDGYRFELEPVDDRIDGSRLPAAAAVIRRLRECDDVESLTAMAVRLVRSITSFDRVMLRRFDDDGTSEVIAEVRSNGLASSLGLRFPAAETSGQIRAELVRKPICMIADVNDPGAAMVPALDAHGLPADIADSTLAIAPPRYVDELRAMGGAAAMTVAIVIEDTIWGLISCHHTAPTHAVAAARSACGMVGDLVALQIEALTRRRQRDTERLVARLRAALLACTPGSDSASEILCAHGGEMLAMMGAVGMVVFGHEGCRSVGVAPTAEVLRLMRERLEQAHETEILFLDRADDVSSWLGIEAEAAAGLCVIPLSQAPAEAIVFFRPKQVREIRWAMVPQACVGEDDPDATRAGDFGTALDVVHDRSAPWNERQRVLANGIRIAAIEVYRRQLDARTRCTWARAMVTDRCGP
ncbi:MAG: GAF domain-containing protein [Burkholderiaceae bacterium]